MLLKPIIHIHVHTCRAMWSQVYSPSPQLPTNTAWDLKATLAQHKQVCFRNLSVGIYGPAAPMTVASWDTPCKRTALMRAWADFVIRGLGLQAYTHYAMSQPSKVVRVSYLTRRPSDKWPEYAHCNDTHSFFKCRYWETGWAAGKRQLGRMLQNDQEVVKALQDLEAEYASKDKQVKVSILDYNKFSFSDQIREDIQTDILIGPHGAGLMHVNFLPDRGQLIELFVDGSAGNRHFHNMASWSGKRYRGESMENPVGISWLLGVVRQAIEEVDVNSY
ncbi:glycosyltransferase family 61 protein [archaeon]|nr:MAG: glycosyltransferase family 61 protein [archaeon]